MIILFHLRKEGPGEKLRVPRQPSQSLAIHEKRQQQQHVDIYQKALKGQENRAIGQLCFCCYTVWF